MVMERGKSDAIHFYSAILQRKKTMDLPHKGAKILSNWEQVLSFVLHPKGSHPPIGTQTTEPNQESPARTNQWLPLAATTLKVRNPSESATFPRFARQVDQDRRKGSRNPIHLLRSQDNRSKKGAPDGMGGPGGGNALAEAVAAGEGTLVEPRVGVDSHRLASQLLHPDGRHDRLQLRQQTLDPHCRRRRPLSLSLSLSLSL